MNSSKQTPDIAILFWLKSLDLPYFQSHQSHSSGKRNSFDQLGQISDGEILWQLLSSLDPVFFRAHRPSSMSGALSEGWVIRFTSFKKMYKSIIRYFEEQLRKSTKNFKAPNLQKIAKDGDTDESVLLCMVILTLVTLAQPDVHVPKIQALPTWVQTALMVGIESVSSQLISLEMSRSPRRDIHRSSENEDVHSIEETLSGPLSPDSNLREKDSNLEERFSALQIEHENLQAQMRILQTSHQDTNHKLFMTEQDLKTAQVELRNLELEVTPSHRRNEHEQDYDPGSDQDDSNQDHPLRNSQNRQEYLLRAELEESKAELTNLGAKLDLAEAENEKHIQQIEEMSKKLDELSDVEELNRGLRDQLDEVRHEMERARKLENVIEKYKKKLDDSADLRRQMKALEEQNSDLLDRNTALEDQYRKVAAFKPLMEQYKSQIATLESEISSYKRENGRLQYELESTMSKLHKVEEEHDREAEERALLEDRVKELEEENPIRHVRRRQKGSDLGASEADTSTTVFDTSFDRHAEEETGIIEGIGGELNDAIEGRTMTSLKLEIRRLQRELKILKAAQGDEDVDENGLGKKSKYLILENLLEDANRMKKKYEDDYLRQYKETLVLSNQLDEVRNGKSVNGEGLEASIALRQRLNETIEELEKLKLEHTELSVSFAQVNQELIVAKSDLNLIGKDQIEILSSLRDSVSTEKIGLMNELDRMKTEQTNLRDQIAMKTEQINSLLLEKISLQSDSIDQREKMLKEMTDQVKSPNGEQISEDVRTKLVVAEQLYKEKEGECRMLKGKLDKAKLFIMSQDKLYKESMDGRASNLLPVDVSSLTSNFDDTVQTYQAELSSSKGIIERLRNQYNEMQTRYEKELRLMASAWHNLGQQKIRETIALNRNEHSNSSPSGGVGYRGTGRGNRSREVKFTHGDTAPASASPASVHNSINLGFGGQLRPQSWVKQQRDRLINQYALLQP